MVARRLATIALAAAVAFGAAILGGLATDIGPWYRALVKPAWQPPDWLFGPAWTLIYACAAAAGALAWWGAVEVSQRRAIVAAFTVNLLLNVAWSWLFFRAKRPDWALAEVALLWLSIVALILVVRRSSTAGAWLLAPYLAWVTFAAALNATIVVLNDPFR
jgi:tryptophan-rich sensory protein